MLYLFTVFHANLGFSAIPAEHASWVIDRCYWPVVELLERDPSVRFGLEFSGETLEAIATVDPPMMAALSRLWASGRCEVVASGLVQSILPLIPAEVNRDNLRLGQEACARLLGRRPTVCYANEQTWSAGVLDLYREAGFRGVILDWENAASLAGLPAGARYRPQLARGAGSVPVPVIWNSSVAFQKFQRYLRGEISLAEYLAYLGDQCGCEDRAFCLYGNDWEIIDYRPGQPLPVDGSQLRPEAARLEALVRALAEDGRFAWATPTEVLDRLPPATAYAITSAACPVPAKKQPKYNSTRWAVCGRDNGRMNAECHALHRALVTAEALARRLRRTPPEILGRLRREVVSLWGSDYRTMATDGKYREFSRRLGHALGQAREVLASLGRQASVDGSPLVFNPGEEKWQGEPVVLRLRLPPGTFFEPVAVELDGRPLVTQWEQVERHRDGSLRCASVVCCPHLEPGGLARLGLARGRAAPSVGPLSAAADGLDTGQVRLSLAPARGGTIRALGFPQVMPQPPVVTVPHGTFHAIELSPDWYSGGVIIFDEAGEKITDLEPSLVLRPTDPESCPLRVPILCDVPTRVGVVRKRYNVYRDLPRIDLDYRFCFRNLHPRSFRVGICTLHPTAFSLSSLRYAAVNGGADAESFALAGCSVAMDEAVSPTVSARGCVGATEGWVMLGDDRGGVAVVTDLAKVAAVPLVSHREAVPGSLTRVYLALAESDETAVSLWRGHGEASVTLAGVRDEAMARRVGRAVNLPLHIVPGETEGAAVGGPEWLG